jgi:hypothetical protein
VPLGWMAHRHRVMPRSARSWQRHEDYRVQDGGTAMLSPQPSTTVRAGHWREADERSA